MGGFSLPSSRRPHGVTLLIVDVMAFFILEKPRNAVIPANFSPERGRALVCQPSCSSFLSRLNIYRFYVDDGIVKQEECGRFS